MSASLPPCDHDECPPSRCLRVLKLTETQRRDLFLIEQHDWESVDAKTIDLFEWAGLVECNDWRSDRCKYTVTDAGRAVLRGGS